MNRLFFAIITVLCLSMSASAYAEQCEGVKFPGTATVAGKTLVLNGLGIREATFLQVDVYVAGLYLPTKIKDGKKAADLDDAKRLDLRFVRDVDRKDITKAWDEGFKKTAGGKLAAFKPRMAKLNGMMSAMKKGQKLVFTYVPQKGVEVSVNGKVKGTVEGADFMKAFFAIWLGKQPPNPGLRIGLLGGACE